MALITLFYRYICAGSSICRLREIYDQKDATYFVGHLDLKIEKEISVVDFCETKKISCIICIIHVINDTKIQLEQKNLSFKLLQHTAMDIRQRKKKQKHSNTASAKFENKNITRSRI